MSEKTTGINFGERIEKQSGKQSNVYSREIKELLNVRFVDQPFRKANNKTEFVIRNPIHLSGHMDAFLCRLWENIFFGQWFENSFWWHPSRRKSTRMWALWKVILLIGWLLTSRKRHNPDLDFSCELFERIVLRNEEAFEDHLSKEHPFEVLGLKLNNVELKCKHCGRA